MERVFSKKDCFGLVLAGFFFVLIPLVVLIIINYDPFGWLKSEIAKNQPTPLPTPTLSLEPGDYYSLPAEVIYSGWEGASKGGMCVEFNQELSAVSRALNQKTPKPVKIALTIALSAITAGHSDPTPTSRKYSEWLDWWQRNREFYPTQ